MNTNTYMGHDIKVSSRKAAAYRGLTLCLPHDRRCLRRRYMNLVIVVP